jgi:hypothetical protein
MPQIRLLHLADLRNGRGVHIKGKDLGMVYLTHMTQALKGLLLYLKQPGKWKPWKSDLDSADLGNCGVVNRFLT